MLLYICILFSPHRGAGEMMTRAPVMVGERGEREKGGGGGKREGGGGRERES